MSHFVSPTHTYLRAIDQFRNEEMFFSHIESGSDHDIKQLQIMIEHDPKKHIWDRTSPQHLINKSNNSHQTPLYVASKNGHLKVLEMLLVEGADPKIRSWIDDKQNESILQVAVRWSHLVVVEFLLESIRWDKKEIAEAIKTSHQQNNKSIQESLEVYSKKAFGRLFLLCFCCFLS
mmetsp:Transcript_1256/g.1291  ORF Transcript_1256/g.1291 Transcript_1256/m.1291 type:complete len:176 (-) Transcript_1256:7-534(-)